MIPHSQTTQLFLADCLPKKFLNFWKDFQSILKTNEIDFHFLPNTKDVWARDYMPVQTGVDQFIQFQYSPDYLQSKAMQKTITDTKALGKHLRISAHSTDIILDGGNVVAHQSVAAITDKVFSENPKWNETMLLHELQRLLQVERIVILPTHPLDFTGHADGMLRFLDDNVVLVNDFSGEDAAFYRQFKNTLLNTGFEVIEVPYNPYKNKKNHHANGCYINYLQMKDVVFVPQFDLKEDKPVLDLFQKVFPESKLIPVPSNEIAYQGGVLNCISWNIL